MEFYLYRETFQGVRSMRQVPGPWLLCRLRCMLDLCDNDASVWFSDRPHNSNEGDEGDTIVEIEIPFDAIRKYLWKEQGKPYREFVIPAKVANRYGPPRIIQN